MFSSLTGQSKRITALSANQSNELIFGLVFLRKCLNMIVSYELSEEHRTDTLTSKTPSGFSLSTPSPFSSRALSSGAREPSCGQTPQQTLTISSAERRSRLSGQICNKKDLESCNGPNGYSVSVSNWISQKPSILKECSLNSQYDISYLVLQSFKW